MIIVGYVLYVFIRLLIHSHIVDDLIRKIDLLAETIMLLFTNYMGQQTGTNKPCANVRHSGAKACAEIVNALG